jgi:hypothetical protein
MKKRYEVIERGSSLYDHVLELLTGDKPEPIATALPYGIGGTGHYGFNLGNRCIGLAEGLTKAQAMQELPKRAAAALAEMLIDLSAHDADFGWAGYEIQHPVFGTVNVDIETVEGVEEHFNVSASLPTVNHMTLDPEV